MKYIISLIILSGVLLFRPWNINRNQADMMETTEEHYHLFPACAKTGCKVWKENDIDVWRNQQYRAQCNHFCRKNTKRLCLFGTECTGNDRTDRIYHADLGACHRLSGLQ